MVNGYDIAYGLGLGLAAPVWLILPKARRKVLKALRERMGDVEPRADTSSLAVMVHAVSLGEMNATRALVAKLREAQPGLQFIISTTTDTGFARGNELYGASSDCRLIRYPLDFSSAVGRVLDQLKPVVVVLMELEVWPNFVRHCERRKIPVVLVNGRLTAPSFRHYRYAGPIVASMFRRLTALCAQEQAYADRFIALGAMPSRVQITGTMKFDNAQVADRIDGADRLATELGLDPSNETLWVCGSTGPGEEEIVLDAYRALRAKHPTLRLAIIPRHPERFDQVAKLIESGGFPVVRRSNPNAVSRDPQSPAPVILGDTMGELRKFYSLADVVLVGRTLVDLGPRQHGSDMIEPAGLAKPIVVGPFTGNFAEVMNAFRTERAMVEVRDPTDVVGAVDRLLRDPADAAAMGRRAQDVVRREQARAGGDGPPRRGDLVCPVRARGQDVTDAPKPSLTARRTSPSRAAGSGIRA
jgi:3-deoxy-D-manno-octulosonic-acid transferase